jgi:DnaJ-class molecular chaperone
MPRRFFGGGGGGKQQKPKGPTITLDLPVTLEDLYTGKTVEVCVRSGPDILGAIRRSCR